MVLLVRTAETLITLNSFNKWNCDLFGNKKIKLDVTMH